MKRTALQTVRGGQPSGQNWLGRVKLTKTILTRLKRRRLPALVRDERLHDLKRAETIHDDSRHETFDVETESFRGCSRLGGVERAQKKDDREKEHGAVANEGGRL